MISLTAAQSDTPSPGWWKPEWTRYLLKLIGSAFLAGLTAGAGFWTTWQSLQAQVSAHARDIKSLQDIQTVYGIQIHEIERRQNEADTQAAVAAETMRSISERLNEIRFDLKDLRRDLTGKFGR